MRVPLLVGLTLILIDLKNISISTFFLLNSFLAIVTWKHYYSEEQNSEYEGCNSHFSTTKVNNVSQTLNNFVRYTLLNIINCK